MVLVIDFVFYDIVVGIHSSCHPHGVFWQRSWTCCRIYFFIVHENDHIFTRRGRRNNVYILLRYSIWDWTVRHRKFWNYWAFKWVYSPYSQLNWAISNIFSANSNVLSNLFTLFFNFIINTERHSHTPINSCAFFTLKVKPEVVKENLKCVVKVKYFEPSSGRTLRAKTTVTIYK